MCHKLLCCLGFVVSLLMIGCPKDKYYYDATRGEGYPDMGGVDGSTEQKGYCGDGIVQRELGESCDEMVVSSLCEYGLKECTVCKECQLVNGEVQYCGDGVKQEQEECEGSVGELTCNDFGKPYGDLKCSEGCVVDGNNCFGFSKIGGVYNHTCGIDTNSNVWCWGLNDSGQLGDGSFVDKLHPVYVKDATGDGLLEGVVDVSVSGAHTCAVTKDNSVWCWGDNKDGQLGDLKNVNSSLPVRVKVESGVALMGRKVSLGDRHSCALGFSAGVWCWGGNQVGQLGDGTTQSTNYASETIVLDGQKWIGLNDITLGSFHSCVLSTDGLVWCWGLNDSGESGVPGTGIANSPKQVVDLDSDNGYLKDVIVLKSGGTHNCALNSNGDLKCWGLNYDGQLGYGGDGFSWSYAPKLIPKSILGGIVKMALGISHTCVVGGDGLVSCWGDGTSLGDGNSNNSSLPVKVLSEMGVGVLTADDISSGGSTCVLKDQGRVFCWGNNSSGQLATGNKVNALIPQEINF